MYLCNKSLFLYSFLICNKNVTCSHSRKERSFMKTKNYWSLASADITVTLAQVRTDLAVIVPDSSCLKKEKMYLTNRNPTAL